MRHSVPHIRLTVLGRCVTRMRSAEFNYDYELQLFVEDITQIKLSDGSVVDVEKARSLIDY